MEKERRRKGMEKERRILKMVVALAVVLIINIFFCPAPMAQEKYTLRLATFYPSAATMAKHGITSVIDEVSKRSKGRLEIKPFYQETLFKARDQFHAVTTGSVDITFLVSAWAGDVIPNFLVCFCPFLFDDYAHFSRAWKAGISDIWTAEAAKHNIILLGNAPFYTGVNQIYSRKKVVRLPSDLKGLKMRSFNLLLDTLIKEAGGTPVSMPITDVYTVLDRGTVDGFISSMIGGVEPMRLYEVAKCANRIPIVFGSPNFNAINKKSFESLPKDLQDILNEVNREKLWLFSDELVTKLENKTFERMKKKEGMEIHNPTREELKEWRKAAKPAWDKFIEITGETGRKQIEIANATR